MGSRALFSTVSFLAFSLFLTDLSLAAGNAGKAPAPAALGWEEGIEGASSSSRRQPEGSPKANPSLREASASPTVTDGEGSPSRKRKRDNKGRDGNPGPANKQQKVEAEGDVTAGVPSIVTPHPVEELPAAGEAPTLLFELLSDEVMESIAGSLTPKDFLSLYEALYKPNTPFLPVTLGVDNVARVICKTSKKNCWWWSSGELTVLNLMNDENFRKDPRKYLYLAAYCSDAPSSMSRAVVLDRLLSSLSSEMIRPLVKVLHPFSFKAENIVPLTRVFEDIFRLPLYLSDMKRAHFESEAENKIKRRGNSINTHRDIFFTKEMNEHDSLRVLVGLVRLPSETIDAMAAVITSHGRFFFMKDMSGLERSQIMEILLQSTPEKIRAEAKPNLFPPGASTKVRIHIMKVSFLSAPKQKKVQTFAPSGFHAGVKPFRPLSRPQF